MGRVKTRLYTAIKGAPAGTAQVDWEASHARRLRDAMDDDFNTPVAIAALFDLAAEVNRGGTPAQAAQLRALGGVIGLLERDTSTFLQAGAGGPDPVGNGAIAALIAERTAAKKAKDFKRADLLRADALAIGVILEDKPGGVTEWRRA